MTYREEIDAKRIEQIRSICRELPKSCMDFLRHIAVTTGTFTRLAYAIDMRTFVFYLYRERIPFTDKSPVQWTDADLAGLTAADLTAFTEYLTYYYRDEDQIEANGLPKATVNHERAIKRKLCSIRSWYDYLFKERRIPSNPTLLVPLPKIHEKPILRLNASEMEKMLAEAETGDGLTKGQKRFQNKTSKRDYAILSLFLGTGIRVSECVGINISDINLEENAFLVTRKGGNQVVLYFPPEVATAVADYLEEREKIETLPGHEDALFLSIQKRRITQRAVEKLVKKYAAVAAPLKPRISPHKLRSTYATNLYHETGDIYLVADMLGHSSVDTTRKHYADMTDARRRMAAHYVHLPERVEEKSASQGAEKEQNSSEDTEKIE